MINIRGVNVYPAGIEAVVRSFAEVVEFRSTVSRQGAMRTLTLEIELAHGVADQQALGARVSHRLRESLGLTVPVRIAAAGGLPRFEMKARRFVVEA
jgi:phenylacetate-CoA ligase